jgi:hypothetical protein
MIRTAAKNPMRRVRDKIEVPGYLVPIPARKFGELLKGDGDNILLENENKFLLERSRP